MATAAATARPKATMASVRARGLAAPGSEGRRRAASRGGPSARARTPVRGRRGRPCASPPPGTLHRWRAPRPPGPRPARADGLRAPRRRRRGSPAGGGGSSATGRSAPRAQSRMIAIRHGSDALWQGAADAGWLAGTGRESARQMPRSVASTACHCRRSSASCVRPAGVIR